MFNFFKKGEEIFAPMSGECVSIERVPDETFSKRMVGDGVAIIPSEGRVVAPLNCTVIQLFETKHAYVLKAECGFEILIHVGIDTVNLKGEGFESYVSVSQKLSKGDMIANVDTQLTPSRWVISNASGVMTTSAVPYSNHYCLSP